MTLIVGADGIFTGLPGAAMRAAGAIRFDNGRVTEVGALTPQPGEEIVDASGCVVYPGLVSTHHHLFQSILKGVRGGIDLPLFGWLRAVPYTFWYKIDEEALRIAARIAAPGRPVKIPSAPTSRVIARAPLRFRAIRRARASTAPP